MFINKNVFLCHNKNGKGVNNKKVLILWGLTEYRVNFLNRGA